MRETGNRVLICGGGNGGGSYGDGNYGGGNSERGGLSSENVMSIRRLLDGHNFARHGGADDFGGLVLEGAGAGRSGGLGFGGSGGSGGGLPTVAFDSAKTVLVPADEYEEGMGESYLRFGGMAPAAGEVVVVSGVYGAQGGGDGDGGERRGDIVAVMAVAAEVWETVREYFEGGVGAGLDGRGDGGASRGRFFVTSPLLEIAEGRGIGSHRGGREVSVFLTGENVYLVVREKGLRLAEVLPDRSTDSLLYYMQVLGRRFKLRKFDILVGGERAKEVAEVLGRYFGNVRVVRS
ncbi:MAG: hypothetical protein LBV38_01325 [Alistipes sp.]|jgi:hypothetical protein|nr:hypothetical protein [Alistipes sp.]